MLLLSRPVMWWSRLRVLGAEAVPLHGPALIITNHDSYWDPIAVGTAARHRRQVRALAKSTLWKTRFVAAFMNGMGHIPVERGANNDRAVDAATEALAGGLCIGVFPEATRSLGRRMRAHSGGGRLALNVPNAELVCARVTGTTEIVRMTRRPRVTVEFFAPAGGGAHPGESATQLMTRCLDEIRNGAPPAAPAHSRAARRAADRAEEPESDAPPSMCHAFQRTVAGAPAALALRSSDDAVRLTWRQYAERVRSIAAGLAGLGVRHGDAVGLMLTNRPEFHLVDTATFHLGATPFSIYNTLPPGQIAHLFANAGNKVVVCEAQFLDQLRAALPGTGIEHLVCVDAEPGAADVITLTRLEDAPVSGFDFDATWQAVQPEDVLTIIYTSGTTGPPKGVELTHANMLAELAATTSVVPAGYDDTVISYLPDAHVANRWGAHYQSIVTGMQVVTLDDLTALSTVLPRIRPTFFGAVPQIWYKIKNGVQTRLATEHSPVKKKFARAALDVGRRRVRLETTGRRISRPLAVAHRLADALVLSKLRAALGLDRVRICASGAAAIDEDALEFVLALGIPCCEVYGMSELSCAAAMNRPHTIRIGTVGAALPGVELTSGDDGELLVRGPLVMKGYRNEPERTAEVIDGEGWLHTGDIATVDDDGYVRIVDRKKELIVNAAGENLSPANIEGAVQVACPLVASALAVGDDRPYVVALVTLDPQAAASFADEHGIADATISALAVDPAVRSAVEAGIRAANQRLSRVEQIKRFAILPDVWEPGGAEMTPTMKLKRRPVTERYAAQIDGLYSPTQPSDSPVQSSRG
jgi:1-acyl-sn-glycerol-3-phosphate acyltransferase